MLSLLGSGLGCPAEVCPFATMALSWSGMDGKGATKVANFDGGAPFNLAGQRLPPDSFEKKRAALGWAALNRD